MPTPDASAFTQFKRVSVFDNQNRTGNVKTITHLYRPMVNALNLGDFLPSFFNENGVPYSRFTKTTAMKANQNFGYYKPKTIK